MSPIKRRIVTHKARAACYHLKKGQNKINKQTEKDDVVELVSQKGNQPGALVFIVIYYQLIALSLQGEE